MCVSMLRMAVRRMCVIMLRMAVCCMCISILRMAVRCMCVSMLRMAVHVYVSVCSQKRSKKERGTENSMEGEDKDKQ